MPSHSKYIKSPPPKWSPEQDELLMDAVQHCGPNWEQIGKYIKHTRTKNSITKRWHGKLKFTERGKKIVKNMNVVDQQQEVNSNETDSSEDLEISNKQKQTIKWSKDWKPSDDSRLRQLVINKGIVTWKLLSRDLNAPCRQIRYRWRKIVYPKVKQQSKQSKIGGSLKWTPEEDSILRAGVKLNFSWLRISLFLPQRTEYSIEARWRRICKSPAETINSNNSVKNKPQETFAMNKHQLRRQLLKKIFCKKRQSKQCSFREEIQSQQKKQSNVSKNAKSQFQQTQKVQKKLLKI